MPYVHLEQDHNNRLIHLSIFRELLAKTCQFANWLLNIEMKASKKIPGKGTC